MNFWWCNQSGNWHLERPANVVCSKGQSPYRRTVGEVKKGDIIVHYKKPRVVAFSRAREDGSHHKKLPLVSGADYGSGWRFATEYIDLVSELNRNSFMDDLAQLSKKNYAVNPNGMVKQGYFLRFDREGLETILKHVTEPMPEWLGAAPTASDREGDVKTYIEGERCSYFANSYERDISARDDCVGHYGPRCWVCLKDLGDVYGPFMSGFIHVHHIVPMARRGEAYEVNPMKDLRPVCPNCHAALHRKGAPSIDDLRAHFQNQ